MTMRKAIVAAALTSGVLAGCSTPPPPPPPPPPPAPDTVSIVVQAKEHAASRFQTDAMVEISSALSRRGYSLVEPGEAHSEATVVVSAPVRGGLDKWFVCEGRADVTLSIRTPEGLKTFARRFGAEGQRRHGRAEAERSAAIPLGAAVANWIDDVAKGKK